MESDGAVRVDFRRSGGIAGIDLTASADGQELAEHLDVMRGLLADAEPQPAAAAARPPGADRFEYELTIHSGTRSRTLHWGEHAVPETARPLIDALARRAKPALKS
jgi:hypothetical protein